MKEQLKDMARPYAMLFLIALAVAIVGRIGLAVMDLTGTLSYDYISAADVPILDVVCSILTGLGARGVHVRSIAGDGRVHGGRRAARSAVLAPKRGRGQAGDGVSVGLGDGACGHRVPADHGERDTLCRAGGVHELEAALPADARAGARGVRGVSRARFWAQRP